MHAQPPHDDDPGCAGALSGDRPHIAMTNTFMPDSPRERRVEDTARRFEASIDAGGRWARDVAKACLDAASVAPPAAVDVVLARLREAAGAERAFLLESVPPPGRARLLAMSTARRDDAAGFSTSVAARALHGERPLFFGDVRREPLWADGASVRSLALRSVLAAPLPAGPGLRAAVVLDSREALALSAAEGCELVRSFAGLLGLVRRAAPIEPAPVRPPAAEPAVVSAAYRTLQDEVRIASRVPLPALVVGETGSGKELVARALHEGGARARRPFVAINCAAIPEALLERELFGATRGAYTGADRDHPGLFRQAEGGTVFLDEIGDMPFSLQAKLLRVLQEGTVRAVGSLDERAIDVRVIAATHRDLATLVSEERFRADLRWRLEVLVLRVPPLRERADDLPALSERLIERLAARCGLPPARVEPCAARRLATHAWPGNVRELESVLARAFLRASAGLIRADDLDLPPEAPTTDATPAPDTRSLERLMIEEAVRAARGNLTAAATRIGWSRQALYRRIHALGLFADAREPREDPDQDDSPAGGTRSSLSSTFQ